MGFFEKLKQGLAKTKKALSDGIEKIFRSFVRIDEIGRASCRERV